MITAAMVAAGAAVLHGQVAEVGCTCQWDENGNPPVTCRCAERAEHERWRLAERVLRAADEVRR
jgi:hypothetical protein